MSVILITEHDENIYSITKESMRTAKRSPQYRSKFKSREKFSLILQPTKPYATMGKPEEISPDPCDFLRKKYGMRRIKAAIKAKSLDKEEKHICSKKPKVFPPPEEVQKFDEERQKRTPKNFIRKNITYVVNIMKPKDPEKKIVVDRLGDSKPLIPGLEPVYIKAQVYGKTPQYLDRYIKAQQKLYQSQKDAIGLEQPKCRYIIQEEREKLLQGLKQNWEELQKQYQGLPILTDTIPKKIRKSKMEAELKQLEKDIVLIERHPFIYVYNDDDLN